MRARYYNPTIQRFVNIDPIRNGYNWYGYTNGNPINYVDPSGYMDWGKQGSIYTQGMYDCMVEFRDSVNNELEKLRNNPLEYLYDKANGIKQDVNDLCIGIANGEITVGSIVKGAFNWTKETISDIYDWGYKWSPFTEISDEEAYQLGYDAEKALLDTSTFVVKSAVTYKAISSLGKLRIKFKLKINPYTKENTGNIAKMARDWQLQNGGYGKADDWVEITLKKGDIVWGGSPGQSNFYTSNAVAKEVGNDATKLYQGLQVGKGNYPNYRPGFTMYEVQENITVGYSKALANNQISKGGYEQYFIPEYEKVLKPVQSRIMTNR